MPDLATTQCTSDTALQKRWSLQPTPPTQIRRRGKRLQDGSGSHKVPALAMSGSKATAPPGWSRISHPEGGYYFCDERKNICTMVNLLDTTMQSAISSFADQLRDDPRLQSCLEVDPDVVLVLHYSYEATTEDTPRCGYYLVSSIGRRVFWLEDFDLPCDIKGCDDSTCLEVQYWRHWQLFPSTCKLTEDIVDTLKSVLLHTCGDHLTAKFSTSQYNRDDLKYMIDLVNEIKLDNNNTHDSSAWLIGKLMTLCKLDELRSSYGQKGEHTAFGRLGPGSRAYERSLPMWLLSPFLLRSPEIYATELHSFRDNFTLLRWRKFVDKVDISIRDSNLLATVLLGTNIGFLSIQSVDDGTVPGSRSPVQIIIYCSTIGSLGSIIVGLVIFKQYRAQGADSLLTAITVLERLFRRTYTVEALAIICSLPYVLLLWSLIFFLAAFSVVCFDSTDTATRVPVAATILIVFGGVYWCMVVAGLPDKEKHKNTNEGQSVDTTAVDGREGEGAEKPPFNTWNHHMARLLRLTSHTVESESVAA